MDRTIITVVGRDTVGIIAAVCSYMADKQVNILDISQTIVQEYFNMMMIVDQSRCTVPFDTFSADLTQIGEAKGVQVKCQREAIFDKMHRI
jgi:ACT domain-containing protein